MPTGTAGSGADLTGTVAHGSPATVTAAADPTEGLAPLDTAPPWLVSTPSAASRRRPTRTFAAAALTVLAAGGIAAFATNSEPATADPARARPATANPATASPAVTALVADQSWCPPSQDGRTVTGNGPGGQQDGPAAILAFDHAYYVLRSGEQARAVVALDAPTVSSAKVIQSAIDTAIPPGTEHCLMIVADPSEVERYWVTLTERRPDSAQETYKQIVTTADQGGRHVITSIGAAE